MSLPSYCSILLHLLLKITNSEEPLYESETRIRSNEKEHRDSLHDVRVIIISRCSVSTYLIRWRDVHINGVVHDNLRR